MLGFPACWKGESKNSNKLEPGQASGSIRRGRKGTQWRQRNKKGEMRAGIYYAAFSAGEAQAGMPSIQLEGRKGLPFPSSLEAKEMSEPFSPFRGRGRRRVVNAMLE